MSQVRFRDVVLEAEAVRETGGRPAALRARVYDSPAGQSDRWERVRVPDKLHAEMERLAAREMDDDEGAQRALGGQLAALLIPPYARTILQASLGRLGDSEGLRLRLRLDRTLAAWPWEMLHLPVEGGEGAGFVALSPRFSIARHEALPVAPASFVAPAERRVLVAMASPIGPEELGYLPEEQNQLRATLEGAPGVAGTFLPAQLGDLEQSATLPALLAALGEPTDVFHFSGHGEMTESGEGREAALLFGDEQNHPVRLSAARLGELLGGRGIRLAVLSACDVGGRATGDRWGEVPPVLLRSGIPAVIAMQHSILDRLAAPFSRALYAALAAGRSIDEAVTLGRLQMRAESAGDAPRDWAAPVLYLRSTDGLLFPPVSDPVAAGAAEKESRQRVQQQVGHLDGRMMGAAIGRMEEGEVEIEQAADEVSGVMVGGTLFHLSGGSVTIRQKAGRVSGDMIGLVIDQLGGAPPPEDATAKLAALLTLSRPVEAAAFCTNCGSRFGGAERFCSQCGNARPDG